VLDMVATSTDALVGMPGVITTRDASLREILTMLSLSARWPSHEGHVKDLSRESCVAEGG